MNKKQELDSVELFLQWAICGVCIFLFFGTILTSSLTASSIMLSLLLLIEGIIICPKIQLELWTKISFSIVIYLIIFN
ncbi:ABC transporter permease [Gloeothece citriformis]|uniref:ABC transporter permease n=1 Tax=Gloeothece citriformis TaxID=2546356 RepID=UPI000A00647A|nr:ABC transporter permease [Gloeothece citriformis]